ncbi:MAG: biopolymer transporter ExbD [Flavobacteriales bacterium]
MKDFLQMPKVKIPRKSTWVDMTAFVDVAFLILSFFMLATKFKPEEMVPVTTPDSVSSQYIEEKNSFMVLMDKGGRVFIQLDPEMREPFIENLNKTRNLGLTRKEIKNFKSTGNVGVSFQQLKPFLAFSPEDQKNFNQTGIPIDSLGGELVLWIRDVRALVANKQQVNWFIKGDNQTRYSVFREVLTALKKNDLNKFSLVTNPIQPPVGTALYEKKWHKKEYD